MVKIVITILLVLNTYTLAKSQSVSVIKEYNDWKVATDMVISNSGFIYICGNSGGEPLLIKLDTNGNEQWIKYYPQSLSGYSFTRMILDSNENIYLHGNNSVYDLNFVCKLDSHGSQQWFNFSVLGRSLSPENAAINMMIHNDVLSVIHNNRNMDNPPYDSLVISQFFITNGNLINYVELLDMIDKYLPRNSPPPFKNGSWILSGFSGVLEVSPNGSYSYQEMGDSIPGILCAAKKTNGYITYNTFIDWQNSIYPVTEGFISVFDEDWVELNQYNYWPDTLPHFPDTIRQFFKGIIPVENKGLIGVGTFAWGSTTRGGYIFQINPDNGQLENDSIMVGFESVNLIAENNKTVIALGQIGALSHLGIRLFTVNFPQINYQTEFITNVEEIRTFKEKEEINIYPNPSSSYFKVSSSQIIKKIKVYTINGVLLSNYQVNDKSVRLKIKQAGIYFIQVENRFGEIKTEKLIIEK
tara:strand:+ start:3682 stop:5091 length:1410 start_codon:yes stop_codon:yes gene_type:complete